MRQRPSLARVVGVVGHGDGRHAGHGLDASDVDGVLVEVPVAGAAAVDVFPCGLVVEGKLVGGDADDGAVGVVLRLDPEGDAAAEEVDDVGDLGVLAAGWKW